MYTNFFKALKTDFITEFHQTFCPELLYKESFDYSKDENELFLSFTFNEQKEKVWDRIHCSLSFNKNNFLEMSFITRRVIDISFLKKLYLLLESYVKNYKINCFIYLEGDNPSTVKIGPTAIGDKAKKMLRLLHALNLKYISISQHHISWDFKNFANYYLYVSVLDERIIIKKYKKPPSAIITSKNEATDFLKKIESEYQTGQELMKKITDYAKKLDPNCIYNFNTNELIINGVLFHTLVKKEFNGKKEKLYVGLYFYSATSNDLSYLYSKGKKIIDTLHKKTRLRKLFSS